MSQNNEMTADEARRRLNYDPETGVITWNVSHARGRKPGQCGCFVNRRHTHYIMIYFDHKKHYAHRLAWLITFSEWPNQIDHIDGDGLNNRLRNLRNVTNRANHKNQRRYANNTTGVTGVCWDARRGKYYAQIRMHGTQNKFLGYFTGLDDAIAARHAAELKYDYHQNHGSVRTP